MVLEFLLHQHIGSGYLMWHQSCEMLRIKQCVPENSENAANTLLENNIIEYYSKISKIILGKRNYLILFNLQAPEYI